MFLAQTAVQQIDSLSALVSQVPLINFIFLGANTYFMLQVKLAVSKLETKIESDRRIDADEIKKWVREEIQNHIKNCGNYQLKSVAQWKSENGQ